MSSRITVQKIIRPPKLTYDGTKNGLVPKQNQFGSITIIPKSNLLTQNNFSEPFSDANNCLLLRLVEMPDETESSKMVKITGKFSRKLPDLVPLKKIVQQLDSYVYYELLVLLLNQILRVLFLHKSIFRYS